MTLKYGTSTIEYELKYAERKTLGIKVYPDKTVKVIAPLDSSNQKIKEKLHSKASWILKQQDYFCAFHPLTPGRKYVAGETHLYLGKQYRLKIVQADKNNLKLKGKYFIASLENKNDNKKVELLFKEWYKLKATLWFQNMFEDLKPIANKFYKGTTTLKFKWMDKRWGSCKKNGSILLNTELIKAPKKCIEYVIIHELCHLKHHNHNTKFYTLLEKELPDWKQTKDQLEQFLV